MLKKLWLFLAMGLLASILVACGNSDSSNGSDSNDETANEIIEDVEANDATETEKEEEEEVEPEPEPEPEPAPVPEAIVYEGNGDDVIKIEKTEEGPVVLFIKGNEESRHFFVKGFDDNDNSTELFVNTTDIYEGITLDPRGTTTLLEISRKGPWTIESRSVRSMRAIESPGSIEGTGDEVLLVEGNPSLAKIKGNSGERHFAVKSYDPDKDLLVNTTDAYEGTTRISKDAIIIEVTAIGEWTISLE